MFCKRYMKTAVAMTGHRDAIFTRIRCKQWSCPDCAKMNASEWKKHLNKRLPEISDTWYLITITARGDTRGHIESFNSIKNGIDRLMKRIRVIWGAIEYVRVYEKHPKSEAVHAHIIMCGLTPYVQNGFTVKHTAMTINMLKRTSRYGCWSTKTWFKKTCTELGMGHQVDVQMIPVLVAVRYVTKYLTKDMQGLKIKALRHVQTTKGIGGLEKRGSDLDWSVGAYITVYSTPAGTRVLDINTGKILDNDFWEHTGFYPDDI